MLYDNLIDCKTDMIDTMNCELDRLEDAALLRESPIAARPPGRS